MRTELQKRRLKIEFYTDVDYQYDSHADPHRPHVMRWRSLVASGETEDQALKNLSQKIATAPNFRVW